MGRGSLTQGRIAAFWLPLEATWLMMSLEGPFLAAVVARLAEPKENLAAFGVAFSFALILEAPVIMIMSASTALAADAASYRRLRGFTTILNALITGVGLVLVLPAVFHFVGGTVIALEPEVERLTRGALILLLPWPAAIGFRRFWHGLLIRAGRTRRVTATTAVRLVAMATTAILLVFLDPGLPGAWVGGAALSAGVLLEAVAARLLANGVIRETMAMGTVREPMSHRELVRFYTPLALTSLLTLGVQPIVVFFMGRARMPLESLAVLPVINGLTFIFRSVGLAYQEVGIALAGERLENLRALGRFAATLALVASGGLAVVSLTPLVRFWFGTVSGLTPDMIAFAIPPTRILILIPALSVLISFERALLVARRRTAAITWATATEVLTIVAVLALGILSFDAVGAIAAAVAFVLGRIASTTYLIPPSLWAARDPLPDSTT